MRGWADQSFRFASRSAWFDELGKEKEARNAIIAQWKVESPGIRFIYVTQARVSKEEQPGKYGGKYCYQISISNWPFIDNGFWIDDELRQKTLLMKDREERRTSKVEGEQIITTIREFNSRNCYLVVDNEEVCRV